MFFLIHILFGSANRVDVCASAVHPHPLGAPLVTVSCPPSPRTPLISPARNSKKQKQNSALAFKPLSIHGPVQVPPSPGPGLGVYKLAKSHHSIACVVPLFRSLAWPSLMLLLLLLLSLVLVNSFFFRSFVSFILRGCCCCCATAPNLFLSSSLHRCCACVCTVRLLCLPFLLFFFILFHSEAIKVIQCLRLAHAVQFIGVLTRSAIKMVYAYNLTGWSIHFVWAIFIIIMYFKQIHVIWGIIINFARILPAERAESECTYDLRNYILAERFYYIWKLFFERFWLEWWWLLIVLLFPCTYFFVAVCGLILMMYQRLHNIFIGHFSTGVPWSCKFDKFICPLQAIKTK